MADTNGDMPHVGVELTGDISSLSRTITQAIGMIDTVTRDMTRLASTDFSVHLNTGSLSSAINEVNEMQQRISTAMSNTGSTSSNSIVATKEKELAQLRETLDSEREAISKMSTSELSEQISSQQKEVSALKAYNGQRYREIKEARLQELNVQKESLARLAELNNESIKQSQRNGGASVGGQDLNTLISQQKQYQRQIETINRQISTTTLQLSRQTTRDEQADLRNLTSQYKQQMKEQENATQDAMKQRASLSSSLEDSFNSAISDSVNIGHRIGSGVVSGIKSGISTVESVGSTITSALSRVPTTSLVTGLRNVGSAAESGMSTVVRSTNAASESVNRLNSVTKNVSGSMNSLSALKLTGMYVGYTAINTAMRATNTLAGGTVSRFDELNQSARSFANLGFSSSNVNKAMSDLQASLKGLPTSLNDAVSGLQTLAASMGDINKAQGVFSALNDAIIGFGGSTDDVNESIIQLSQAFSNGKIDAQTWNSLMQHQMGPAFVAIAKEMGVTTAQLKSNLSSGKISIAQFQQALIDLDTKGGGGIASLHNIALQATNGISTAFTNAKTATVRGLSDILESVNNLIETVTGKNIAGWITQAGSQIESHLDKMSKQITAMTPQVQSLQNSFKGLSSVTPILGELVAGVALFSTVSQLIPMFASVSTGIVGMSGALAGLASPLGIAGAAVLSFGGIITAVLGPAAIISSALAGIGALTTNVVPVTTREINNVVNAMINGLDQFEPKVNALLPRYITAGTNVAVAVLNGFAKVLPQFLGEGANIIEYLMNGMLQALPQLAVPIASIFNSTLGLIAQYGPRYISAGTQMVAYLLSGFISAAPRVISTIGILLNSIMTSTQSLAPRMGALVTTIVTTVAQFIANDSSLIMNTLVVIVQTLINTIAASLPSVMLAINNIITGIAGALPRLQASIRSLYTTLLSSVAQYGPQFIVSGTRIVEFLLSGLTRAVPSLIAVVGTLANAMLRSIIQIVPQLGMLVQTLINSVASYITRNVGLIIQAVTTVVVTIVSVIINTLPQVLTTIGTIITQIANSIGQHYAQIVATISTIISDILNFMLQYGPQFVSMGLMIVEAIVQGIVNNQAQILNVITLLVQQLSAFVSAHSAQIAQIIMLIASIIVRNAPIILGAIFSVMAQIFKQLLNGSRQSQQIIMGALALIGILIAKSVITSAVSALLSRIGLLIASKLAGFGLAIAGRLAGILTGLLSWQVLLYAAIAVAIVGIAYLIVKHWPQISRAIGQLGHWMISGFASIGTGIMNTVKGWISGIASGFISMGRYIVAGLAQGITNSVSFVKKSISNLGSGMVNTFKKLLGIHSPSRVFLGLGQYVVSGLANGLSKTSPLTSAVGNMSNLLKSGDYDAEGSLNLTPNIDGNSAVGAVLSPEVENSESSNVVIKNQIVGDAIKTIVNQKNARDASRSKFFN